LTTVTVGIAGGSGYVGLELLRYLLNHPRFRVTVVTSREHAGNPVSDLHAGLAGLTDLRFTDDLASLAAADVVFTAVPHRESMKLVSRLRELRSDLCAVDLGADFRLPAEQFELTYGEPHGCPGLLREAVYGVPELQRQRVSDARLVANPGCFAHCTILALAPLAQAGLIDGPARVSAITGSTGSGAQPTPRTHHPARNDSLSAYNVLSHRHVPEIEHALSAEGRVKVDLVPLSGPLSRGIFATLFARLTSAETNVEGLFRDFSAQNRFIRLRKESPRLLDVRGTNFCDLAVHQRGADVVIVAAIDNLGKGAAGNAVQCANLMFGFPEEAGLLTPPVAP
jgi:N-acetyl-gamma-glutamyl-phosphate reductase